MQVKMEKRKDTHLNVDDEDIILCGGDDRGQGADESLVEWREECGGRSVVQSYRNRVIQHWVGNKSHEKLSHRANFINPIYKAKQ